MKTSNGVFRIDSREPWRRRPCLTSTGPKVGRWWSLPAGACPSSTKTATLCHTCTPESTAPSLMSATCCKWVERNWLHSRIYSAKHLAGCFEMQRTRNNMRRLIDFPIFLGFFFQRFLQTKVHGKDRIKFIESLVVADIAELKDNQVTWKTSLF